MATTPGYAATPNHGFGNVTTAETNLTVPTQAVLIWTAGASGSKLEEVRVQSVSTALTAQVAASVLYLFWYDGTTYWLWDTIPVTATTASTTVAPFSYTRTYPNQIIKAASTAWKLYAAVSVTPTTGSLRVGAYGADF